jgi:hypothetical protein
LPPWFSEAVEEHRSSYFWSSITWS